VNLKVLIILFIFYSIFGGRSFDVIEYYYYCNGIINISL
jgi:hypothetical protein